MSVYMFYSIVDIIHNVDGKLIIEKFGIKIIRPSGFARNDHGGGCVQPQFHRGQTLRQAIDDKRFVEQRQKIADFAAKVHAGEIRGSTGKPFSTVTQIGIGGSDLGPRALYLALENWAAKNGKKKMDAHFISNVDPDDGAAVIASLNPEETLAQGTSPDAGCRSALASLDARAFSSRITASPASSHPTALTAIELRPNCDT